VARLLLSTTIGGSINRVGKKNYIIIGFLFLIFSTAGFSGLYFIKDKNMFLGGAVALRFIQGIGGTCLQVTCYSIILVEYAARKEVGLSYLSAARGLGFLGGPVSGQLFYSMFGYIYTFMIFAGILSLALLFTIVKLPSSLNVDSSKTKKMRRMTQQLSAVQKSVTYCDILKIKRALFCLVTVVFALIFSVFFEPFLTENLKEIGFDKNYVGYFFGIFASMYTVMAFLVGPLTKRFTSKKVSFCSYILIALGCIIFGPSNFLTNGNCYSVRKECLDFGGL